MVSPWGLRRLVIVAVIVACAVAAPGLNSQAMGPVSLEIGSQPSFTVPGAVLPIQVDITGATRLGNLYATYDLETTPKAASGRLRTPDLRAALGQNLLQWLAPTPRTITDAVSYRVQAQLDGQTVSTATATIPYGRWLNAGGNTGFRGQDGVAWEPDRDWLRDGYGFEGATRVISTTGSIDGAAPGEEALYRQQRAGVNGAPFHYRFHYGQGLYQARLVLELRFAEIEANKPGQRVFDVLVDGQPLIEGLDVCALAGAGTAYAVTQEITVTYSSAVSPVLDVAFVPRKGDAAVAAVAVRGISAVPQYTAAVQVANWADDAHVMLDDGSFNREPYVRLGRYEDGFEYAAGILFRNLPMPHDAYISSAWLEVWSYPNVGWQYGSADVSIYAQAADSAPDFGWAQPRANVRPLTAANARWVVEGSWLANQPYRSVDFAPVVQEVTDRARWRTGSSLALLVMPNGGPIGWRDVVARDWPGDGNTTGAGKAAVLHITYVPPLYRPVQ